MRVLAPPPTSTIMTKLANGYQLCARCGEVMVENESAVVVPRAPFWLIHTHQVGPNCPPKAVKGWKAVRACEALRNLPNAAVPRDAEPMHLFGSIFPSRCLLDDKHIESELTLVNYHPSDESPANSADIRALLSRLQFRMSGGGRRAVSQNGLDGASHSKSQWRSLTHNFVEDDLITSIDDNGLSATMQVLIEVLWSCRRRYATLQTAPSIDPFPHAFVDPGAQDEVRIHRRRKALSPRAPYEVLAWDAKGRPAEFALYSKRKVLRREKRWISELEAWAPKPEPVELPYSSTRNPDLYTWQEPPQSKRKSVRHWPMGESQIPYGPVAVLKPEVLASLNAQRKTAFRVENIEGKAAGQLPIDDLPSFNKPLLEQLPTR